jgi:hypothetical protein
MGVEKQCVTRGGKNIIFGRGEGINIVFGPKYRPLSRYVILVFYWLHVFLFPVPMVAGVALGAIGWQICHTSRIPNPRGFRHCGHDEISVLPAIPVNPKHLPLIRETRQQR